MALPRAVDSYLAELSLIGRSVTTVELQTYVLHRLTSALGLRRQVRTIDREDLVDYFASLAAKGLAQSYIASNAKVCRRFFNWLVERGEITQNPLGGLRIAVPPDKPVPPFTDEECRRLIAAADTPLKRAVLLVLIDTGLRASEVSSLSLANIDFQADELTVKGKGGKIRRLALNPPVKKALIEDLASRAQLDGHLWPRGWHRKHVSTIVDSIAKKAHVTRVFPHRFRHNMATRMARGGIDVLALQKLLGHSSLKTTARYISWVEQDRAIQSHRQHSVAC